MDLLPNVYKVTGNKKYLDIGLTYFVERKQVARQPRWSRQTLCELQCRHQYALYIRSKIELKGAWPVRSRGYYINAGVARCWGAFLAKDTHPISSYLFQRYYSYLG